MRRMLTRGTGSPAEPDRVPTAACSADDEPVSELAEQPAGRLDGVAGRCPPAVWLEDERRRGAVGEPRIAEQPPFRTLDVEDGEIGAAEQREPLQRQRVLTACVVGHPGTEPSIPG